MRDSSIAVYVLVLCAFLFAQSAARAEAVSAGPDERAAVAAWAADVFGDPALDSSTAAPVELQLKRQDFSELHFRMSCVDTPLRIGDRGFERGLGTHANSEIAATLPEGAVRFEAFAGIDNNHDTGGQRGSVVFIVDVDGAAAMQTPVLHGGDAPYHVTVDLPAGAQSLTLKTDTTADGPAHDQADWADARYILADGTAVWLDDGHHRPPMAPGQAPFSFRYADRNSRDFLADWERAASSRDCGTYRLCTARWTDPATRLCVTAEIKVYQAHPAVDWVLSFENGGTADTPLIEDIQALDLTMHTGTAALPVEFGHNRGDVFSEASFENATVKLEPGNSFALAPQGGRSSNGAFPFFDLRFGNNTVVGAIGWSGQWALSAVREDPEHLRLRAGMERTRLALHPGEKIRTPRILLLVNTADAATAHNRFRRLLLAEYLPKIDGQPVVPPVALQCFDRYYRKDPEWATEAGQLDAAQNAAALGFDTHWLDAAWFPKGFPTGVGSWFADPALFPNGLRPVGDLCHKNGIRFLLWFEPERVAPDTQIASEHPDFVHGGEQGGLYRLDLPEARRWLTDTLSARIEEYGLDIYRNDFNMDPLEYWRKNDSPGREGLTEIRYIEGLYAMWDELLARHPGLIIDNCSSGGRRIDLETCTRSIPLWRSDTNCFPGNADWNPGHSIGISYYLPAHTATAWQPEPYAMRAAATAGLICQWDYRNPSFPAEQGRRFVEEARALSEYWYGDIYPMTLGMNGAGHWCAFQLDRPDLGEGAVYFFRRSQSPYTHFAVRLSALAPSAVYALEYLAEDGTVTLEERTGESLAKDGIEAVLAQMPASLIVRYAKKK